MHKREPTTQTMPAAEAVRDFGHILERVKVKDTRMLIEEDGVPIAAIVSADDYAELKRPDDERAERFTLLARMRAAFADIPEDQIARDVAAVVQEERARQRVANEPPSGG